MKAATVFQQFIAQHDLDLSPETEQLLLKAYELIQNELEETAYSIESVRLAYDIFGYLGDKGLNGRVKAMRNYLASGQPKSLEDQFWANWELVDNLALLKQYKPMVEEQKKFLAWAKNYMPMDDWIKVMFDSTQAIGWVHEGQVDEWFGIYYDLLNRVQPTEANRIARTIYVETAAGLLVYHLNKLDEAAEEIERYHAVIHEDASWAEYGTFFIRLKSYQLGLYSALEDWLNYEKTVNEAVLEIIHRINRLQTHYDLTADEVCDMAHEIGTCLMWEKRYKQAMPLFEYAVQNQGTGITHFFYAICVWAEHKDRQTALRHLELADRTVSGNSGLRARYKQMFLEQEEFADVWEDEQFLSVFLSHSENKEMI